VDHAAWLRLCLKSMTNRHDNDLAPIDPATQAAVDSANLVIFWIILQKNLPYKLLNLSQTTDFR
jgi:hypothetical protein